MLMHPAVPVQVGFPRFQLLVDGPSVTDGPSATNVVKYDVESHNRILLRELMYRLPDSICRSQVLDKMTDVHH